MSWLIFIFQKGQLLQIPSLDYSNEEELTDDTKLMYEKFDKKMDQCEYLQTGCFLIKNP